MADNIGIVAGQTVYNRDGEKYLVREVLQEGRVLVSPFLISSGWEGEDHEYAADEARIRLASDLLPDAPTAVIAAEIAAARNQLTELRAQLSDAQWAIMDAGREKAELEKRLAASPKFDRLLDYLDGKITHFVCSGYQMAFEIKTWEELAVYQEDRRDKGVKLLTLFGNSKGDTEWRLNQYRDGSGCNSTVFPCTSEDEARRVIGEQLALAWGEFKPSHPWFLSGAVNSARTYGFPVPTEIADAISRHSAEMHERTIQKMKDDLAAAEARYAAFQEASL